MTHLQRTAKKRTASIGVLAAASALLLMAAGCSRGTEAAPTKAEVTVDPNVFTTDRPELFKIAKSKHGTSRPL